MTVDLSKLVNREECDVKGCIAPRCGEIYELQYTDDRVRKPIIVEFFPCQNHWEQLNALHIPRIPGGIEVGQTQTPYQGRT